MKRSSLRSKITASALAVLMAATLGMAGCAGNQKAEESETAQEEQTQAGESDAETTQEEQTNAAESDAEQEPKTDTGVSKNADGSFSFTDDAGNSVTVESVQRVVACMGSFADMWGLAGGTLVGASDDAFTTYDIPSDVAKVGDFTNPNLEEIISLEPDFVIMTCGTGGRGGDSSQLDLKETLDESGIPVAYFEVTTFDDYARMMRTLCDLTERQDLYEKNVTAPADQIAELVESVPAEAAPRVAVLTTFSGGTRVQASQTMVGSMLGNLGAANIADENRSLLSDFSLEALIEENPDFIFVIPMGNSSEDALRSLEAETSANPAWATLDAVENGRYVVLDPELYLYKPNNKWAESYQGLYDHLYGDGQSVEAAAAEDAAETAAQGEATEN